MDTYCLIGNLFCIGDTGRTFHGPCILGPDAITLVVAVDGATAQLDSGMRGVAGLMDKVSGLVQLVPIPGLDQFEVGMDELIERVGADPAWPAERVGEKAYVFPRSSIVRLRFGLAGLRFNADGRIRVNISTGLGRRKPGLAYLQRHGWPIDTRSIMDRLRGRAA